MFICVYVSFHQLSPLGRVGQRVDMSVCLSHSHAIFTNSALWAELVRESTCPCVCPLPMRFFSRPLIGSQVT